jgi:glycosyltransferase involved in cell wall biosynthesis
MRYCVLYPQAENIHMIKDVGMIAYKLFKLYSYDSTIACYNNDEYSYLKKEVKGLKTDFIDSRYNNEILDGLRYLRLNSKNIEVLQLFHITLRSVFYTFAYKFYNPKGKIFLKLDCTKELIDVIRALNNLKLKLLKGFLNKINIIGVEQNEIYDELKIILKEYSDRIVLIPNGIDYNSSNKYDNINFFDKENIILHVGRLGSPEKATDTLLNAFSKINEIEKSGWKISMIGPIEDDFKSFISNYFEKYSYLRSIIQFKGPIYDRDELYEEYKKAKIFCLSSRYESFGIALLEAASFGDVIVSTDVGIAKELVSLENGVIVKVGDIDGIADNIKSLMESSCLENLSKTTEKICRDKYDWNSIITLLHEELLKS